jgi:hypothetical protein
VRLAKRRKREVKDGGINYYQSMSTYDIVNALHDDNLPLSDNIHGPYKMMLPKLLHTSGSGLIMYMFESVRHQVGGGQDRDFLDQQRIVVFNCIKRQSERDFSRGSMRNGQLMEQNVSLPNEKETYSINFVLQVLRFEEKFAIVRTKMETIS